MQCSLLEPQKEKTRNKRMCTTCFACGAGLAIHLVFYAAASVAETSTKKACGCLSWFAMLGACLPLCVCVAFVGRLFNVCLMLCWSVEETSQMLKRRPNAVMFDLSGNIVVCECILMANFD